ncbi:MAG: hotdog fold thioesterase [Deltaproteobacteria bacterium]|nr:hotdog fold thioesterase [Candidatus Anaeroferrophillacea bacterium]
MSRDHGASASTATVTAALTPGSDTALTARAQSAVERENYARGLGITVVECRPGYAAVEMTASAEMTNLFGMIHGGAIFSLADEAFQLACNTHGTLAVALNVGISYVRAPRVGDTLRATGREISIGPRVATYFLEVRTGGGDLIATAQATAYRKLNENLFHD